MRRRSKGTRNYGTKTRMQVCTLQCGGQGMVGRHQLKNHSPHRKTGPQVLWTIPHHEQNLQRRVPTRTPPTMENSQCVSHLPTNSIQGNQNSQGKLPRTSPGHHRRGTGIQSGGNLGVKMDRKELHPPVLSQVEGVLTSARLLGTHAPGPRSRIDQTVANAIDSQGHQIFPTKENKKPIKTPECGSGDPRKLRSPISAQVMLRNNPFARWARFWKEMGCQAWKKNPGLTYETNGKRHPKLVYRQ